MGWTNDICEQKATFETTQGLYFSVEVYYYKTKWYMSCEKLGVRHWLASPENLEEAKEEAMDKIVEHLANIIKEMAKS